MIGEIEVHSQKDGIFEFGIGDTCFRVCIETSESWETVPVSHNGLNDEIEYEEYRGIEKIVQIDTLCYEGELLYTPEEICKELTKIINQNKDE
tara:strand:+ start:2262 stop:2540 length:279 start_codon:yes stop_codon:yes gene_type:complete